MDDPEELYDIGGHMLTMNQLLESLAANNFDWADEMDVHEKETDGTENANTAVNDKCYQHYSLQQTAVQPE